MRESDRGLQPDRQFDTALEQLVDEVSADLGASVRINHLTPAIDSAEASADWAPSIARAVRARVRASTIRAVVITHGTDTMSYVAARLAFELATIDAPVIVTGAQWPHGAPHSDAEENLRLSLRTAAKTAAHHATGAASRAVTPVTIGFGGLVLPAVRAQKFSTVDRAAFRAHRPLANGATGIPAEPELPTAPFRASPARVVSLRMVPGITPSDVEAIAHAGASGLVLECYGSGTAPMSQPGMRDVLESITSQMPVVAVSQCEQGNVEFGRYAVSRQLQETGVLNGRDLTVEAALAKLGFLLDRLPNNDPRIAELMSQNLIGECAAAD